MGQLGIVQYTIVVNVFSLMVAAMGAGAAFFLLQRDAVLPRYRTGMVLLAIVCAISTYSYYRLFASWSDAYQVVNGAVRATGLPFNETYRYADWLLTVPLLLVAFLSMMDLPSRQARLRMTVLSVLSVEMILLGYPGQLATTTEAQVLWFTVAMLPALIIVYQLFVGLNPGIAAEPPDARRLFRAARLLTLSSWAFYPVICLLPVFGVAGSIPFTVTQVVFAAADMAAKVAYGVVLFRAAAQKSLPVEEVAPLAGTLRAVRG